MTAMLRQVPEEYRLAERMSNKALYYSDDIQPRHGPPARRHRALGRAPGGAQGGDEQVRRARAHADRRQGPEGPALHHPRALRLVARERLAPSTTTRSSIECSICWVDDSEEQDREVFRRKMAERGPRPGRRRRRPLRPPRLPRDLAAAPGRRPRPRRRPVRGPHPHGLGPQPPEPRGPPRPDRRPRPRLPLPARAAERLEDGGLAVVATEEDFRYAAAALRRPPHHRRLARGQVRPERAARALARGAEPRRAVHPPRPAAVDGVAVPEGAAAHARVRVAGTAVPGSPRQVAGALAARPDHERGRRGGARRQAAAVRLPLRRGGVPGDARLRAWSGSNRTTRRDASDSNNDVL